MSERKKIVLTAVITAFVTAVVTCSVTLVSKNISSMLFLGDEDEAFANKIKAVDAMLSKKYLYDYDKTKLREIAVSSYVESLAEPYTHYYTPSEFSSYMNNVQDGYVGIGVMVGVNDNNQIEVIAPFEDSPAYKAGVLPGDILKAVEGTEYSGEKLTEAVEAIKKGKEGTTVNITFVRGETELELNIERGDVSSASVKAEKLDGSIGYIRITSFNGASENGEHSTSSEFRSKLSELREQGAEKLIIDLRDNPGGVLTEVCNIADALLPEGTITYIEDKSGERKYYSSDAECIEDIPMAVLINGNSASASEVLTGALKDYGRTVVVGERSYGKGLVQEVYPFFDGSGISITSAKYYTPNGTCVQGIGIEPDAIVEMPEEYSNQYISAIAHSDDVQLKKAIELIGEK